MPGSQMRDVFCKRGMMTWMEQEIQDLKAKAEKDGFLNYKVIYQYVEENKSEM